MASEWKEFILNEQIKLLVTPRVNFCARTGIVKQNYEKMIRLHLQIPKYINKSLEQEHYEANNTAEKQQDEWKSNVSHVKRPFAWFSFCSW